MNPQTSTAISYTMGVYTRTHAHTHIVKSTLYNEMKELASSITCLLSALSPSPSPWNKTRKKKGTLPIQKSLFMRYYHSYRTKPWMWPSPLRTLKGQEKKFQTRVHNSSWKICKKKEKLKRRNCCCTCLLPFPSKARPTLSIFCPKT